MEERELAAFGDRDGLVVSGEGLPPQFHLGRACTTDWIQTEDRTRDARAFAVKPAGALWTSPAISRDSSGAVETTWSRWYFGQGVDAHRRATQTVRQRLRSALRPERQWRVRPDSDAVRIVRLASAEDLREAQSRWSGEHGRISFGSMAADGVDAVWVHQEVVPLSWMPSEWDRPGAQLHAQFFGWDVECVAWLRPDHITAGEAVHVARGPSPDRTPSVRGMKSLSSRVQLARESVPATRQQASGSGVIGIPDGPPPRTTGVALPGIARTT